MSWILAASAGMAALGAVQKKQEADQAIANKQADMRANAAQIQYSPWTHASVNMQGWGNTQSPQAAMLAGAEQGGLSGAMFGSQFGSKFGTPSASPGVQAPAGTLADPNSGTLYRR